MLSAHDTETDGKIGGRAREATVEDTLQIRAHTHLGYDDSHSQGLGVRRHVAQHHDPWQAHASTALPQVVHHRRHAATVDDELGQLAVDTQTDRQTDRQADRQAGRQAGRQTGRQTDRQADRQADRHTDTDTQTGRQIDYTGYWLCWSHNVVFCLLCLSFITPLIACNACM